LQHKYRSRLDPLIRRKESLTDYFSSELGMLNTGDPTINLQRLAGRHRILSGAQVNWLSTYQHAVQGWINGLEIQKA
jgi:hypothetical protein